MSSGTIFELPGSSERERLLDGLAALIKRRGPDQLTSHPILLPESLYFPDRWRADPRDVGQLLRRLLGYAGLPHLDVCLEVYREPGQGDMDVYGRNEGGAATAAWYQQHEGDVVNFGVNTLELGDVEELIGTLGHEVAHAYRHEHDLVVRSRQTEEELTDLTSVYLGFGLFLLKSSWSFKTGGYSEQGEQLLYKRQERGYPTPAQIAWLLAAQLTVRGQKKEANAVIRDLPANHADLVRRAQKELGDPETLRLRLGIGEPSEWPDPPALEELAPDEDGSAELLEMTPEADADDDEISLATSPIAFRVRETRRGMWGIAGLCLPLPVLYWAGVVPTLAACLTGAGVGFVLGNSRPTYWCSECDRQVETGSGRCGSCGHRLVGGIAHRRDRLEAEETYWEQSGASTVEPGQEEASPEEQLLGSMFAAWALRKRLNSKRFRKSHGDLCERVRGGENPSAELATLLADEAHLSPRGRRFADYYFESELPARDWELLSAVELRDNERSYNRVATLLDAHLESWSARDNS